VKKRMMVRVEGDEIMEKGRCGESGGVVVVAFFAIGAWEGSNGVLRDVDDAVKMHSYRFWIKFGDKRV
jgi:hypothetical protein